MLGERLGQGEPGRICAELSQNQEAEAVGRGPYGYGYFRCGHHQSINPFRAVVAGYRLAEVLTSAPLQKDRPPVDTQAVRTEQEGPQAAGQLRPIHRLAV